MNATRILTLAGDLGHELVRIEDAEERLQTIAAVCTMLADAIDDGDYCTDSACELRNAASNALGNIAAVREEEAEHDLMLECAADRRDEWETERRERRKA